MRGDRSLNLFSRSYDSIRKQYKSPNRLERKGSTRGSSNLARDAGLRRDASTKVPSSKNDGTKMRHKPASMKNNNNIENQMKEVLVVFLFLNTSNCIFKLCFVFFNEDG